jgi:hypothetical protein
VQALLVSPILLQRRLHGYVTVGTTTKRRFTREDLEFLLVFVAQGAAGFETVRLQEKAEEVAVLEERARIARDLHDGFIQSLAAIDLRVEAAKVLVDRTPDRLPRALEELHQVVDRGYQDVRHYLTVLRNTSRPTEGLLTVLDRLAAEFSLRTRIRVLLSRPDNRSGPPARPRTRSSRRSSARACTTPSATARHRRAVVKLGRAADARLLHRSRQRPRLRRRRPGARRRRLLAARGRTVVHSRARGGIGRRAAGLDAIRARHRDLALAPLHGNPVGAVWPPQAQGKELIRAHGSKAASGAHRRPHAVPRGTAYHPRHRGRSRGRRRRRQRRGRRRARLADAADLVLLDIRMPQGNGSMRCRPSSGSIPAPACWC